MNQPVALRARLRRRDALKATLVVGTEVVTAMEVIVVTLEVVTEMVTQAGIVTETADIREAEIVMDILEVETAETVTVTEEQAALTVDPRTTFLETVTRNNDQRIGIEALT